MIWILGAWRTLGLAGRIAAGLVAVLAVIVAVWWVKDAMGAGQRAREAEMKARTETAHTAAARDAINTVTAAGQRDQERKDKVDDELNRIKTLPEGERNDAYIRALCMSESARGSARCAAVLNAHPK